MSNVPGPTPGPYDTGVGPTGMVAGSGRPDAYAGVPTMQRTGRPVAGALAGLFFGFFLGVTLLLFGVISVSGPWLLILTVGGIIGGALWGWWAPLGKREKPQAIPMTTEPGPYPQPTSAQYYPQPAPGAPGVPAAPPLTQPVAAEPPPTQAAPATPPATGFEPPLGDSRPAAHETEIGRDDTPKA